MNDTAVLLFHCFSSFCCGQWFKKPLLWSFISAATMLLFLVAKHRIRSEHHFVPPSIPKHCLQNFLPASVPPKIGNYQSVSKTRQNFKEQSFLQKSYLFIKETSLLQTSLLNESSCPREKLFVSNVNEVFSTLCNQKAETEVAMTLSLESFVLRALLDVGLFNNNLDQSLFYWLGLNVTVFCHALFLLSSSPQLGKDLGCAHPDTSWLFPSVAKVSWLITCHELSVRKTRLLQVCSGHKKDGWTLVLQKWKCFGVGDYARVGVALPWRVSVIVAMPWPAAEGCNLKLRFQDYIFLTRMNCYCTTKQVVRLFPLWFVFIQLFPFVATLNKFLVFCVCKATFFSLQLERESIPKHQSPRFAPSQILINYRDNCMGKCPTTQHSKNATMNWKKNSWTK